MADVARTLPRLKAHHDALGVDGAEGINHDLPLDRLDGINDDGHCARVKLLEGLQSEAKGRVSVLSRASTSRRATHLLSVDVDAREPAAESWVRVIPTNDHLRPVATREREGTNVSSEVRCFEGKTTHLPVCLSMSSILVWNTGSTASTDTPVPL